MNGRGFVVVVEEGGGLRLFMWRVFCFLFLFLKVFFFYIRGI